MSVKDLLEAAGAELLRDVDAESDAGYRIRRAAEWEGAGHTPGWQDLFASITTAKDVLVRNLIAGSRGPNGQSGDDEKRAMIHAMTAVLKMPEAVRKDAEEALKAVRQYESMKSTGRR